jgi:dolichyl-phosphate beta-glucosyltransferase
VGIDIVSVVIPSKADLRTEHAIKILRGWQDNLDLQFEIIVCGELAQGQVFEGARFIKVHPALKGACVKAGVLASHGSVVVVCDSDIPLDELDFLRLLKSVSVSGLAIGRRYYNHQTTHLRAPYYRQATSYAYRFLSSLLFQLPRRLDPQCGIKVYSRPVAQFLFQKLTMLGLAYDIEIIVRARLAKIQILSIPIQWKYSESSISLFRDGRGMLKDILLFR